MKKLFLTTLLVTASFTTLQAAEVDAFTKRFEPVEDTLVPINRLTNELLAKSLERANARGKACNERHLYKALRKNFNNQYAGKLPKIIIKSDEFAKIKIPSKESIYRDFTMWDAIVQGGTSRISDPIADLMKVNGIMVGTDKFEHFLGSGYRYFKKHYQEGKPLEEALKIGWKAENGILGAVTTGVMAYADLAANFNGMRFWNHILQQHDDVLGENFGPYVACENDQWVVTDKKIDWSNYIDESFDEGINCSRFKNEKVAAKVQVRLEELEANDPEGRRYSCPMTHDSFNKIANKYGELAPLLINSIGHNALGDEQFDTLYLAP